MQQFEESQPEAAAPKPPPLVPKPPTLAPEPVDEHEFDDIIELTQRSTGRDDKAVMTMFARLRGPAQRLRAGDAQSLRDHLVLLHAPLVEHCARNYVASGEPLEDLLQEGYVGLIKAVDRFEPDKGVRFSTYACHLITGEVRHYLRDLGKLIHEPGWHSELRSRIARTGDELSQRLARPAQPEEIAESLGVRPESVRDVLRNTQVLAVDSLDEGHGEDSDEPRRAEMPSNARLTAPQVEERVLLGAALPQLKELEKRAIHGFFFEEKSKTQVAHELGISVNYAAYLIKQGTVHLREIIEGSALDAPATPSEARAAYLLSLVRKKLWPEPSAPSAPSGSSSTSATGLKGQARRKRQAVVGAPDLVDFAAFVSVLDDELRRCRLFEAEMGVVWLWASNWAALSARWGAPEQSRALEGISLAARHSVRGDDRVALAPLPSLPDLHLVVALPHTGATGRIVQDRLLRDLQGSGAFADSGKVQWKSALAVLPHEGHSADALFESLAARLLSSA